MATIDDVINSLSSDELDTLNSDPKMLADFKAKYAQPVSRSPESTMAGIKATGSAVADLYTSPMRNALGEIKDVATSPLTPLSNLRDLATGNIKGIAQRGQETLGGLAIGAKRFIQSPISTTAQAAVTHPLTTAALAGAGDAAITPAVAGAAEDLGVSETLNAAGVRRQTLNRIAGRSGNPSAIGGELSDLLNKNNVISDNPGATLDNFRKLKDKVGQQIGSLTKKINPPAPAMEDPGWKDLVDQGKKLGLGIPTKLDGEAQAALQPLKNEIAERSGAMTSLQKSTAKPFQEIHDGLVQKALDTGGTLTLSHIKDAMDEVGSLLSKGSQEAKDAATDLYHSLADVWNNKVESLASRAGTPAVKQQLLDLNRQYSLLSKVHPDVINNVSKDVTTSIVSPIKLAKQKAAPVISKGLTKLSDFLSPEDRTALQNLSTKLLQSGPSRAENAEQNSQ